MAGDAQDFRFRIGAYSPDSMPMARLADYLRELATLLGEPAAVHLVSLEAGSTVVVHRVDPEAVPKVRERATAVAHRRGHRDAMRAYRTINNMLRHDNSDGALQEPSGAELIQFPGINEMERYGTVTQQCVIEGEVVRIGGTRERVPITLQSENELITDCYTSRATAKRLAAYLFEPVQLFGSGRLARDAEGTWKLEHFSFDTFSELDDRPLSNMVEALRAIPGGEWSENALDELRLIRYGTPPAVSTQNGSA